MATDYTDFPIGSARSSFIRGSTISLTHTTNVEPGSKDHREQKKDRDQHDEAIPKLLQH